MAIKINTSISAESNSWACGSTRSLSSVKYIVVHYTGVKGDTAKNTAKYFKNNNSRYAGAHFSVGQDGSIYQSIGLGITAWAVGGFFTTKNGAGSYYQKCTNSNSVSIEMCDNLTKDPSSAQTEAVAELVAYIRSKCKNAKTILRHWDVNGKSCPGRMTGKNSSKWKSFKKSIDKTGKSKATTTGKTKVAISGKEVVTEFIKVAEKQLGKNFSQCYGWLKKNYPPSVDPWCACFVSACAGALNIKNVIYQSPAARTVVYETAHKYGGTLHNPKSYKPKKGDLVYWGLHGASHVNIVYKNYTGGGKLYCIGGNQGGGKCTKGYRPYPGDAEKVVTPKWSKAKGYRYDSSGKGTGSDDEDETEVGGPLYKVLPTKADATIRDVGYVDSNMKGTTKATDFRIGTANYTQMLYDIWELSGNGSNMDNVNKYDLSNLPKKVKTCVKFFLEKGLTPSAACGIAGNIYYESEFDTTAHHNNNWGLVQWEGTRFDNMKEAVGDDWKSNYSGQLDYIWTELTHVYKSKVLSNLRQVDNNSSGVSNATFYVAKYYTTFTNDLMRDNKEFIQREEKAKEYFKKIKEKNTKSQNQSTKSTSSSTSGGSGSMKGKSGKKLKLKKTVNVPIKNCIIQDGNDCTDYSYWSGKLGWIQGKVAKEWRKRKQPHVGKHGCGTLDGHFTVAMRPIFGNAGDLVRVICKDGTTFSCVLVDIKGSDATSKYGHVKPGGIVSPVEWYYYSGSDGKNSGGLNFSGCGKYKGKKVVKVENYGSWINN